MRLELLKKLIRNGSKKIFAKANLTSMAIGTGLIIAGIACVMIKALTERGGEPETNFYLLPFGALLTFCGVIAFAITGLKSTVELLRSQEPSVRCECLSVALRCGSVTLCYLAMIMFLLEANSGRKTLPIFLCCAIAAIVSAAAAILLKMGANHEKK